jgi:hypothetical protein
MAFEPFSEASLLETSPTGDRAAPSFGYTAQGDPIPYQTNALGDMIQQPFLEYPPIPHPPAYQDSTYNALEHPELLHYWPETLDDWPKSPDGFTYFGYTSHNEKKCDEIINIHGDKMWFYDGVWAKWNTRASAWVDVDPALLPTPGIKNGPKTQQENEGLASNQQEDGQPDSIPGRGAEAAPTVSDETTATREDEYSLGDQKDVIPPSYASLLMRLSAWLED